MLLSFDQRALLSKLALLVTQQTFLLVKTFFLLCDEFEHARKVAVRCRLRVRGPAPEHSASSDRTRR